MVSSTLFSSDKEDWETPQDFFDRLDREFWFALDACATPENAKCRLFWTKKENGLDQSWLMSGAVWCNPPYGKSIGDWIEKAWFEATHLGAVVVMLLPVRTDTQYWHEYVMEANEIRFVKGRLKFVGAKSSAPFPSCVVVFRKHRDLPFPVISTMLAKENKGE